MGEAERLKNFDVAEEKLEEVDEAKPEDDEENNGCDLRHEYVSDLDLDDANAIVVQW